MQSPRRNLRQRSLPKVLAPMLRERGGLGAQGGGQHHSCRRCDQGSARAGGQGAAAAQLEARQGVWGDSFVDAQPCQGDFWMVHM